MDAFVGIDPGATGAIALVTAAELVGVWDMPAIPKAGVLHEELLRTCRLVDDALDRHGASLAGVAVERVAARTGQGVTSMFTFGRAYGFALDIASALCDRHHTGRWVDVTPQRWKRDAGLIVTGKQDSCRLAAATWPAWGSLFWGPRGGTRDGRAEAALIANWAAHADSPKLAS